MRALDVGVIILLRLVPFRAGQDRVIGLEIAHAPLRHGDIAVGDEGLFQHECVVAGVPFAVSPGVIVVVLDVVAPFHDGDELFVVVHILVGSVGLLFKEPLAERPEQTVEVALGVHGKAVLVAVVLLSVAVDVHVGAFTQLVHLVLCPLSGAHRVVDIRQPVGFREILVVEHTFRLRETGHIEVAHREEGLAAVGQVGQVARGPPRLPEIDVRQVADRLEDVVRDRHAHIDDVGHNGGVFVLTRLHRGLCRVDGGLRVRGFRQRDLGVEAVADLDVAVVERVVQRLAVHLIGVEEYGHSLAEHGVGFSAEIHLRQTVRVVGACRFRLAVRIGGIRGGGGFRVDTAGFRGISAVSAGREREEHGDEEQNGGELLGSLFHLSCLSVAWFIYHVGQSLTVGFLP